MEACSLPIGSSRSLAAPSRRGPVTVDGCDIRYHRWGPAGRPGIVLVHGGRRPGPLVGPRRPADRARLRRRRPRPVGPRRQRPARPVPDLDLGARGRRGGRARGRRGSAGGGRAQHGRLGRDHRGRGAGRPTSRGSWCSTRPSGGRRRRRRPTPRARRSGRCASTRASTTASPHFRTVPDQPTSLPYVLDHIARTSLREVEGGWSWKFDPRIFDRPVPTGDLLRRVTCRVALVPLGVRPRHPRHRRCTCTSSSAGSRPVIEVPLADHHVMLDQPLPLVTGLRTLLADWDHSVPQRRRSGAATGQDRRMGKRVIGRSSRRSGFDHADREGAEPATRAGRAASDGRAAQRIRP